MDWDDVTPKTTPSTVEKRNLEPMGVAELADYITALQAEIQRAEAAIAQKNAAKAGAAAFFKR